MTRAANGIAYSRLGASHLRGVSVPRTSQKAYVAEEIFASLWDRALMAYRVSSSRAGQSSRRCEDTGCRVIRSPSAVQWYSYNGAPRTNDYGGLVGV
jgi:hypothetical protein